MKEAVIHGGALQAAIRRFGGAREDWLDLSTGISPHAPDLPEIDAEAYARLPEREAEEALREAARGCYGAGGAARIVLAPGTQSLISLWPHLLEPCEAAVVSPTYAEHERALRSAGHDVARIAHPAELPSTARCLVVVNPNNPDARRFGRSELLALCDTLVARGGLLVVDEAFMDADPRESVAGEAGRPGLLVLRSFGKFFGLAGLRLGFALCDEALAARIEARLGPWPVSGPALAIATALMNDRALVERRRVLARDAERRLRAVLTDRGLHVEGSAGLFALVRDPRAGALFEALARRRILTRPFAERSDWLRFGLPRDEGQSRRLSAALGEALAEIDKR